MSNMPGKKVECTSCGKVMRSDNLKRHQKICGDSSSNVKSKNPRLYASDNSFINDCDAKQIKIGHGIKKSYVVKEDTTEYPNAKRRKTVSKTNDREINDDYDCSDLSE